MKKIFSIGVLLFFATSLFSQNPTADQQKKVLEEAQRKMDSLMKNDPNIKKYMNNTNGQTNTSVMITPATTASSKKTDTSSLSKIKFPAKKTALLASLPKHILTRTELKNFLTTLYAELQKIVPAKSVSSSKAIITKYNSDAAALAFTGVAAWYNKAPYEALLTITYAASQLTNDDNTLNNCAAILNLCGLQLKAIPILKYALNNEPKNTTLLNNIGQAYAGLGETDTAMVYFMGCISKAEEHPEACATAAYIEYQKGDIAKATQFAEQAIKGGYTEAIGKFYKSIKRDASIIPLKESNFSDKKFFELNGFDIAPNCRDWNQCESVYALQQAFKKKIDDLQQQFSQTITQNSPAGLKNVSDVMAWSQQQNWTKGPLYPVAQEVKSELEHLYAQMKNDAFNAFMDKMNTLKVKEEAPEKLAFEEKWNERLKGVTGPGLIQLLHQKCEEGLVIDNKYFDAETALTNRFKTEWIQKDIKTYDELVYLDRLTATNENVYQSECAAYALQLINWFSSYSEVVCSPNSKPDCAVADAASNTLVNNPLFGRATCPINYEFPFIVGKINIDCSTFKIEWGEGIIFNFEKNFRTGESTVAVGPGVAFDFPGLQVGGFHPLEAGAKGQFFVKFDDENEVSDIGSSWEAELDVKGSSSPEIKVGYQLSVSSGFNFEPGILEPMVNGEIQANSNVRMYNE